MVLSCGVSRDKNVHVTWQWKHKGSTIAPNGPRRVINPTTGSLTIRTVSTADIGTFSCHVTSRSGNDSATAMIQVIGKCA